jgi:hypothetical protein
VGKYVYTKAKAVVNPANECAKWLKHFEEKEGRWLGKRVLSGSSFGLYPQSL